MPDDRRRRLVRQYAQFLEQLRSVRRAMADYFAGQQFFDFYVDEVQEPVESADGELIAESVLTRTLDGPGQWAGRCASPDRRVDALRLRGSLARCPHPPSSGRKPSKSPTRSADSATFGGRFVPETLMDALNQLAEEYDQAKADPEFQARAERLPDALRRPALAAVPRRAADASWRAGPRST